MIFRIGLAVWLTWWSSLVLIGSASSAIPISLQLSIIFIIAGSAGLGWIACEEHAKTKRSAP
jgi:hypothetical protein